MKLAALALGMACTLGAVTLEEIARLAPKEPVRPAPKALKDAVRAWAEPQFLTVRNPLPVAVAMKAAMERAGLGKVVEDVQLLHPSGQREFVVLVTKLASNCGSDFSLHLYRWKNASWRHLLTNENHGETHLTAPMYDPTPFIRLSTPNGAGERMFALSHRTPTRLLEDLDEGLEGDPMHYLLRWLEERIAPQGDLAYRVTDSNAKLSRFQPPKAVAPARIQLVPGGSWREAELILHTAGKATRMKVTYRNGQWEVDLVKP